MSMNVGSATGEDEPMVEMNTTPLIDVMLVMLTLLILTLPPQTHAVKLDMPQPNQPPPTVTPVSVDLGVDFDGTITWNGDAVDRATLDSYLANAAATNPHNAPPPTNTGSGIFRFEYSAASVAASTTAPNAS